LTIADFCSMLWHPVLLPQQTTFPEKRSMIMSAQPSELQHADEQEAKRLANFEWYQREVAKRKQAERAKARTEWIIGFLLFGIPILALIWGTINREPYGLLPPDPDRWQYVGDRRVNYGGGDWDYVPEYRRK
jgi:hypothetical protein